MQEILTKLLKEAQLPTEMNHHMPAPLATLCAFKDVLPAREKRMVDLMVKLHEAEEILKEVEAA